MLRPRITPCLLIRNGGLVKTVQFEDDIYVGDPINAVKIFNEKSVDEIIILDIDASVMGKEPDYKLINKLADESRMPLCYGGGIKNSSQAKRLISMGIEKLTFSSSFFSSPELIKEVSEEIGKQSVVAVFDVKKNFLRGYSVYINNGKKKVEGSIVEWLSLFQDEGVGEILFNSIDRDGKMNGYDMDLLDLVQDTLTVPSTFLGGASSMEDFGDLIAKRGIGGCAAGSLFVFKGKYKAVLINYPRFEDKQKLIKESLERFIDNRNNQDN